MRAALGAGRGRIVRGLLVESALLGCVGGLLGLALARAGLAVLVNAGPATLPRLNEIGLDGRALAFTLAISLLSGLLFGLMPALRYAGPRIAEVLRGGGRTSSQSRERHRARNVLVVIQVALALVLLVGSGLMIRTFQALRAVEPGFTRPDQLQTVEVSIPTVLVPEPERVGTPATRHRTASERDSGRDLGRLRERDADGPAHARLGRGPRRGHDLLADRGPSPAPLQVDLAPSLRNVWHTLVSRPGLHLDRSLRPPAPSSWSRRTWRASSGARRPARSASGSGRSMRLPGAK